MHPTIVHLAAREHVNDLLREVGYQRPATRTPRRHHITRLTRRLALHHTPRASVA